jgi:lipoate---protein ligase
LNGDFFIILIFSFFGYSDLESFVYFMQKWRIVEMEVRDAFMNMAIDEAVSEKVADGESPPTIRFYRWNPSAVSIGYFQGLHDEVAVDACNAAGVSFVRRKTGGGAVYHDFHGEITYSVIAPEIFFPKGIIDSYHTICGWIVDGLKNVGIETEFKPINDIVLNRDLVGPDGEPLGGKKISGNAQTRRNGVLLQHGTILYKVDVKKMFSFLRVGQTKIADKMIAAVTERVSSVNLLKPELSMDELRLALLDSFTAGKRWEIGEWTLAELMRASDLAERRYSTKEWLEMR